jgi:hypothetical protein
MISLVFESKRFRVQINGNVAHLESRDRQGWIFRNQYNLPIQPKLLKGRGEFALLTAAVRCFERARPGDRSLSDALTASSSPLESSYLPTNL